MKQFVPNYAAQFACKMGECRHTCCAGWEIDIDEETREYYRSVGGALGSKLRACVDEENHSFRLTEDERCPFLRRDGLCELIVELGEESLCQICRDHPRFYNDYAARSEMGFGLTCEAAAELILSRTEKMCLVEAADDGEEEEDEPAEKELFARREEILGTAQNRSLPLARRVRVLREMCDAAEVRLEEWRSLLLSLERLDEGWTERLNGLIQPGEAIYEAWALPLEQFLCYLIYRHLTRAEEVSLVMEFILRAVETAAGMLAAEKEKTFFHLCDICRQFSSEIEYSDENIDAIYDFLAERREDGMEEEWN